MSRNSQQEADADFGPGPTGLYRDPKHARIAGVCAGLADYFGVNRRGLRIALIILSCVGFFGPVLVGYVVLAILLPIFQLNQLVGR